MAKKIKKPDLSKIKSKLKGKVYVGNPTEQLIIENKALKRQTDSLQRQNDSLKQVVKIRTK